MIRLLFLGCVLLLGAALPLRSAELPRDLEHQTFDLINQYRVAHQLPPLLWNRDIADLARRHSRDMATDAVPFGHEGLGDRMHQLRVLLPGLRGGGENVFESDDRQAMAAFAVATWLKSPPHLHNIRGDYSLSGLGLWRGKSGAYYFTQIFAKTE